ncbi:caspase-2-like [Haliotis cracherodii]|uniref:caspase-2-like n=1 Tax=Haliotis cracherodii TaxID=6455 RepID=UPI0039ED439E
MMEKKHKEILIKQRANLVENINPRDGLFTQLISQKVLNPRSVRTIQYNRPPDQQVEELLNVLPTRGPEAFSKFCEALKEDDQEHVLDLLKCEETKSETTNDGTTPTSESGECSRKRAHSPSPQVLCIKDKDSQNLMIKYLASEEHSENAERKRQMFTDGHKGYEQGEPRHTFKHWISEPGVVHIGRFVPVDPLENYMAAPASLSGGRCTPYDLSRCDSLDAMTKRPVQLSSQHQPSSDTIDSEAVQIANTFDETEDAQIDLTDGPVNVKVDHTSRQFFLAFQRKSYPMQRLPRGKALIINVNEVISKPPRRGTDIDRDNLHNLLKQLHFDVQVFNDKDGLTAQGIVAKLKMFSSLSEHLESNCSVVCLLSHGEEGYVFGTDGKKIPLDEIFMMFDNTQCRGLIGKPKVFFIQACRGGALDPGVRLEKTDETDGGPPVCPEPWKQLPTMSDMVICYPTQYGYYAWRNRERGSWYIEAIVQIFMRHAKNEDICTMLNRVNHLVSRKVSRCPQIDMDRMTQMSEYKSTLRKPHLFFFPGIGSG